MNFITERNNEKVENRLLIYRLSEFSFDMIPGVTGIDFELIVNKLTLTVIDSRIIQIVGFCGNSDWIITNGSLPSYFKGSLKINDTLDYGFSYRVNESDFPVYFNEQTGWVCLGEVENQGEGVEFINNCVAVIGEGKLKALWLKPKWES